MAVWVAVLAMVFVLASGLIVGTLLLLRKSFGSFTETMAAAHKSNMLAYRENLMCLAELKAIRDELRTSQELAIERAANFCNDDRKEA